jgi:hypothetical protein
MRSNPTPSDSADTPETSTPRPVPARRMTQRELVILSLLACPNDSPGRGLT